MPDSLCVFCGSKNGTSPIYAEAARELGHAFAERRIRLVYGGGNVGLMGVIADAVLDGGGEVIGVIPQALVNRELAHAGVRDMRIVDSMHARKALMAELSDGFIALPGGLGTFEEFFEVFTWAQLGFHHKKVALLNSGGYYDDLLQMLRRAVDQDFLRQETSDTLFVAESVEQLVDEIGGWPKPERTLSSQELREIT